MAEDLGVSSKDVQILRLPKSPFVLKMVILTLTMVSGIYICSICLRQINYHTQSGTLNIQVVQKSCELPVIEPSEKVYVHFPKPKTFSRAECACNPVRYFVILSMQRSGSGWFETLLNSHLNISSNGEIFSVHERRKNISSIVGTLDKIYNLDWMTSAAKNECTAAVGLKWMLNQGLLQHHKEIADYFKANGVSVIFLFRRNLLRRMISILANSYDQTAKQINGQHKSHVHLHQEAEILAKFKPRINATLLMPNLRQVEGMVTGAMGYFNATRHILLYYEDLIKNRTKLVDAQDFLKVPRRDLSSHHVKIHKGPLSAQVENWEDIRNALNGTQYGSFLHEDYRM